MDYRCPNCGENLIHKSLRAPKKENTVFAGRYGAAVCPACGAVVERIQNHPSDKYASFVILLVFILSVGIFGAKSNIFKLFCGALFMVVMAWSAYVLTRKKYTNEKFYRLVEAGDVTEENVYAQRKASLVALCITAPLSSVLFSEWLRDFARCRSVFGVNGMEMLLYVYAGLPLVLLFGIVLGSIFWPGIRARQFLPLGLRPAKIETGRFVVLRVLAIWMVIFALLIGFSFSLYRLASQDIAKHPDGCTRVAHD